MTIRTHTNNLRNLIIKERIVLAELLVTEQHTGHRIHKLKLSDKLVLTQSLKSKLSEAFGFVDYCTSFRSMDADMLVIYEDMMN